MAKVRFTKDYDWKPTSQSTVAFRAGDEKTVTRDCAEKAVAAGAAKWVGKPPETEAKDG